MLPDAIAVNSLVVNIARAIGPALGGVIVATAGSQAVFTLAAPPPPIEGALGDFPASVSAPEAFVAVSRPREEPDEDG